MAENWHLKTLEMTDFLSHCSPNDHLPTSVENLSFQGFQMSDCSILGFQLQVGGQVAELFLS